MSADDFYAVKYDRKRGGWIVVMGFMSDTLPAFATGDEELFAKGEDAYDEAHRQANSSYSEYGVMSETNDDFISICYPDEYREYAEEIIEFHQENLEWLEERGEDRG